MNGRNALLALAFAGMAALSAHAQQPPARAPLVKADATQKLSPHVFYISDESVPGVPNVGFIVGTKGTLVVETGMGPPNGRTVLAEARKVMGKTKLYLVTTHVHPEHDLGAQAFPKDVTFIRSNAQVKEIAEDGMKTADAFRARSEVNRKLLEGAAFRKADVTFDDEYKLDLGGVHVRLISLGPAHTQGDTGIWVEEDKVLFAGDTAMKGAPAFASSKSSVRTWLATLYREEALKPAIIVPSHGPIGDAKYISGYRAYLTRIQARAAALKKEGRSADDAVTTISAELKADYPDAAGRIPGAARAAYAEAP